MGAAFQIMALAGRGRGSRRDGGSKFRHPNMHTMKAQKGATATKPARGPGDALASSIRMELTSPGNDHEPPNGMSRPHPRTGLPQQGLPLPQCSPAAPTPLEGRAPSPAIEQE